MKLVLASDVHTEFKYTVFPNIDNGKGKILALLGDIGYPSIERYYEFIKQCVEKEFDKIYIIAGNHEYYKSDLISTKNSIELICKRFTNVFFLERSSLIESGYRILGCTLWSDVPEDYEEETQSGINDYVYIKVEDENGVKRTLTVKDSNNLHKIDKEWLIEELKKAKENNEKVIVLTHHAPLLTGTSATKYQYSANRFAFATDLSEIIKEYKDTIVLWGSGHTHYSYDFKQFGVRFVSNQYGYRNENNYAGFKNDFEIEL
ncbi:hypothetical protein ABK040_000586 [Willaertia magna]